MFRFGFTLVELMIVVAIIGILAAIAVPNFMQMQYRAKRAEAPANVNGIKTAEIAYEAIYDVWVPVAPAQPPRDPDKVQADWPTDSDFKTLGWAPDGKVRGIYMVAVDETGNDFTVIGDIDVDDDELTARYTATKSIGVTFHNDNHVF